MSACKALILLGGINKYACEVDAPHPGVVHFNGAANACWASDGEVRAAARKVKLTDTERYADHAAAQSRVDAGLPALPGDDDKLTNYA